jgi:hypothetical protein
MMEWEWEIPEEISFAQYPVFDFLRGLRVLRGEITTLLREG